MTNAEKTYSDTMDLTIRSLTPTNLFDHWNRFEDAVFRALLADQNISRGALLNAGAGRRITESEAPFFDSFAKLYLLEPDQERRAALAENTKQRGAILLSNRIEQINTSLVNTVDFAQCKYVLQHIDTDLLPLAVERLKSVVAKHGFIGIFSASSSSDSYFNLRVPENSRHLVPAELKENPDGRISEAQFNQLMRNPPTFPFIATHHFSQHALLSYFSEWNPIIEMGPFDNCFMLARKPALSRKKKFLGKLKAIFNI